MPRRGDDGAAGARKACRRPRRTNPRKDLRHDHPEAGRRPAMTDVSVRGLSKRYGGVTAVADLTFDAPAGEVTGFLGPNGSGKTTTLRMLLGLVRPTAGEALIGGRHYARPAGPRAQGGAGLDATCFHPRPRRPHPPPPPPPPPPPAPGQD